MVLVLLDHSCSCCSCCSCCSFHQHSHDGVVVVVDFDDDYLPAFLFWETTNDCCTFFHRPHLMLVYFSCSTSL